MRKQGFTLIELLIVIAIIAILALIAIPNFIEAQTRSRVSRAEADMRTVGLAIESYATDWTRYPTYLNALDYDDGIGKTNMDITYPPYRLTTPIAYMTSILPDPFRSVPGASVAPERPYLFWHTSIDSSNQFSDFGDNFLYVSSWRVRRFHAVGRNYWGITEREPTNLTDLNYAWFLCTAGPDLVLGMERTGGATPNPVQYDPTNGVSSPGDLMRWGP
jgi:prepilin-type N-terminal cleavage/methylation domain-containing protein